MSTPQITIRTPERPDGQVVPGARPARRRRWRRIALRTRTFVLLAAFVLVVGVPVAAVFISSFTGRAFSIQSLSGGFDLEHWIDAYTNPRIYSTWWDTLRVALTTTVLSTVLGAGLAWLVAKRAVAGARFLRFGFIVPLFMPTILTALGLVVSASLLESLTGWESFNPYSFSGLVLALTMITFPFIYLMVLPVCDSLPRSLEEAGELFGKSRRYAFRRITVGVVGHAILGAAILAAIRLIEVLDIALMLGAPAGIDVFATTIYNTLYASVRPSYGEGAALAASVTVTALIMVVLYRRYVSTRDFTTVSGKGIAARPIRAYRGRWAVSALVWGIFLLAAVLPLGATLYGSFQSYFGVTEAGLTTTHWQDQIGGSELLSATGNTVVVAGASALLIVVVGTAVSYVQWRHRGRGIASVVDRVAWLPWTVPGFVLALGLLWVSAAFIGLGGWKSMLIMVLAFSIIYIPLGIRQTSVGLSQIDVELEEASHVSGFGGLRSFTQIVGPLLLPSILAAALLCFALVARDTSTALFVYSPGSETLGVHAINYWRLGAPSTTAVYGTLIALVNVVALAGYAVARRYSVTARMARQS